MRSARASYKSEDRVVARRKREGNSHHKTFKNAHENASEHFGARSGFNSRSGNGSPNINQQTSNPYSHPNLSRPISANLLAERLESLTTLPAPTYTTNFATSFYLTPIKVHDEPLEHATVEIFPPVSKCNGLQDADSDVPVAESLVLYHTEEGKPDKPSNGERKVLYPCLDSYLLKQIEKMEETTLLKSDNASTDHSVLESDVSLGTEDDSEPAPLQARRREVIDSVMSYFHMIFRAMPAVNHGGHNEKQKYSSQAAQGASRVETNITQEPASSSSSKLGKHPRRNDRDGHSDDDENEDDPKRPRKSAAQIQSEGLKRKFACPYFKRHPEEYLTRRSCVGPGWDEVRRVKEHLYRNHALPIFCRRCYTVFKTESMLDDHQRAPKPCVMRPKENIEGFNKFQHEKLRSRKRSFLELGEAEKWRDIYRILFPSDDEALMPSPYLDVDWQSIYQKVSPSAPNELVRYEQYLRRELPPAVRRELEHAVEREFSPIEERLKSQLIDIVRDLQIQLFQSYTQTRLVASNDTIPQEHFSASSDVRTTENYAGNSYATIHEPLAIISDPEIEIKLLENQLASFKPAPPLDDNLSLDIDPILFQFDDFDKFEDSAYGSMFADTALPEPGWEDVPGYCYNQENVTGEGSSDWVASK